MGGQVWESECGVERKEGKKVVIEWSIVPVVGLDSNGRRSDGASPRLCPRLCGPV